MNFSENLINERKKRGWSQEKLAEKLNISRQSISKWENNEAYPDLPKLIKLSEIFHISLDELCGQSTNQNEHHLSTHAFLKNSKFLILILIFIISFFLGCQFSSSTKINLPEEITISHLSITGVQNDVYVEIVPSFINNNADYYILVTSLFESKRFPLRNNDITYFTSFTYMNDGSPRDLALVIETKDDIRTIPIAKNLTYNNFGVSYTEVISKK